MSEHLSLLIHHNDIEQTVSRIASRISEDYKGRPLLVVGILKGAFIFMADLVRQISIPIEIDFVTVSSYGSGTESSRRIRLMQDMTTQVK
ncbi:MAG: hypoxanthine phosphoribosyltransferase, partial [Dehalococcoidia bacterium]|nr:hypoxanthine phosphoribosyltransferase [Dehalococcoidia bacterium]